MKGRKTEFLINMAQVKNEKQKRSEETFADLYAWMFSYLQDEANLREIVRAKHLFRHKLDLNQETAFSEELQVHFEHWMLFDYVTIVGSRMLDLFIRSKKADMSRQMLEMGGILMLMHPEPVRVIEKRDKTFILEPLFQGKYTEAVPHLFKPEATAGDLMLTRMATIGFKKMMVGPPAVVSSDRRTTISDELETEYDKGYASYRRFLKEYGVDMLRYSKFY